MSPDRVELSGGNGNESRAGSVWNWHERGPWGLPSLFLVVVVAYAIGSRFALFLLEMSGLDGVFFIPAGVTVAFLLRLPKRVWWVVLVGAGLTELAMDLGSDYSIGQAAGFVAANVVEPLVGALIVTAACGVIDLARRRHLAWFILGAVLTGPAVGAAIGATGDWYFGGDDVLTTFAQWWLGDGLGVILVGAAILVWGSSPDRASFRSIWGLLLIVGSSAVTVMVLTLADLPLVFTVLIGVVVAGAVFGSRAVAVTSLVVALTIALTLTVFKGELIIGLSRAESLLLLKVQLALFSLAGLVVAAEAFERELAMRAAAEATLQAALADRERRQEHNLALRLQRALLPDELLKHPQVSIAARYEATSDALEVGGDWYDTISLRDGQIGVVVGDVVGHGIEAMTSMGRLRSAVAALALHTPSPGELLTRIDEFVGGPAGTDFATVFYGVLDPTRWTFRYASAGHPPPLVVTPAGESRWLGQGLSEPLYGEPVHGRPDTTVDLEPGSLLLLYSDGLVERRGESLEVGLDRLRRIASTLRDQTADEICDLLVGRMGVTSNRSDDVVVVAMKLEPSPLSAFRFVFPARPSELRKVRARVRSWAEDWSFPPGVEDDLLITLGEACSNAVRHAYDEGDEGDVEVVLRVVGERIEVKVRDFGMWKTTPEMSGYGGLGTDIMRSLSEDFARHTGADGTIVGFSLYLRNRVKT